MLSYIWQDLQALRSICVKAFPETKLSSVQKNPKKPWTIPPTIFVSAYCITMVTDTLARQYCATVHSEGDGGGERGLLQVKAPEWGSNNCWGAAEASLQSDLAFRRLKESLYGQQSEKTIRYAGRHIFKTTWFHAFWNQKVVQLKGIVFEQELCFLVPEVFPALSW